MREFTKTPRVEVRPGVCLGRSRGGLMSLLGLLLISRLGLRLRGLLIFTLLREHRGGKNRGDYEGKQ